MNIARIERVGERVRVWFRCRCGNEFRIPSGQPFTTICQDCREASGLPASTQSSGTQKEHRATSTRS